jgi:pilus assembly protein CpaE
MPKKLTVLIASRSKEDLTSFATELEKSGTHKIETRHILNGHADPLYGLSFTPDVVVMVLNDQGHADLEALVEEQQFGRPPMIVIAEHGDADTMRLAMRAGARDFLCGQISISDLQETIDRTGAQVTASSEDDDGNLTIFVNAKGGSGATFLACNVAHILTSASKVSTAMMSLDLQFSALSQYFDLELRHGLMSVLDSVESLDDVALDAYMTQHESGLRLLAAEPENIIQCHSDRADQLTALVDKMMDRYEHVVIDMPRRIDPYVVPVLERANRIVLVLQQTLGHLNDAKRMLDIFENYGISRDQVHVVINRYDKNAPISTDDVERSMKGADISVVPSDFKTVAESINLGVPMHEHARGSAVTKALLALETRIGGHSITPGSGFLGGVFSNLLRKDKWSQSPAI